MKKDISPEVHRAIKNYQLTSNSKLLKRLNHKNASVIISNLQRKHQEKHLLELIHKRDYYNNKLNELLNSAGEQSDPKLIEDDFEAEYYLARRFSKDPDNVNQVKAIIAKHKQFQQDMAKEHEHILSEFNAKQSKTNGLAKLKAMNASQEASRLQAKEVALRNLYLKAANRQSELARESEAMLRELKVPFFCMDESISIDDVQHSKNKAHMIDSLYKLCES